MQKFLTLTAACFICAAVFIVFILQAQPTLAGTPSISLQISCDPCNANAPVPVQILASNVSDLAAFEFELSYDPTLIASVASVTPTDLLGTQAGCDPQTERCVKALGPDNHNGLAAVGAYTFGSGPGSGQNGVIATLILQPTGRSGSATLHISNALYSNTAAVLSQPAGSDLILNLVGMDNQPLYLPLVRR